MTVFLLQILRGVWQRNNLENRAIVSKYNGEKFGGLFFDSRCTCR